MVLMVSTSINFQYKLCPVIKAGGDGNIIQVMLISNGDECVYDFDTRLRYSAIQSHFSSKGQSDHLALTLWSSALHVRDLMACRLQQKVVASLSTISLSRTSIW